MERVRTYFRLFVSFYFANSCTEAVIELQHSQFSILEDEKTYKRIALRVRSLTS